MKRILCALTAVMTFSFIACNSGSEKHTLSLRLAKGDTFNIASNSKMDFTVEVMGTKQEFKMNSESESRFEVLDSTAAGAEMKMTILKQQSKLDVGKLIPDSLQSRSDSASMAMIGKSIYFKIKDQKISDVRGFEEINRREDSAVAVMMKKFMPEETFEQTTNLIFDVYPPKAVTVGESWKKETTVAFAGIPIKLNTMYKLKNVKDDLAEVAVDGKVSSNGAEMPMMPGLKINMDGKYNGTITLQLNTGFLRNSNYEVEVRSDQEFTGEKVPITIKGKFSTTGK